MVFVFKMCVPTLQASHIVMNFLDIYKGLPEVEDLVRPKLGRSAPEDFLKDRFSKSEYGEDLQKQIASLFFNVVKCRPLIEKLLEDYYIVKSKRILNDSSIHEIFAYATVMLLDPMTKPEVENLLIALNVRKALSFLSYLRKPDILTKLFEWGVHIWDVDYVKNLLSKVIKEPLFDEVYKDLATYLEEQRRKNLRATTVPMDMAVLNYPMRTQESLDAEESHSFVSRIPVLIRSRPIPASTYVKPPELRILEKRRKENQRKAQKLYDDAQKNALRVANPDKSFKYLELLERVQKERDATMLPKKKITKPNYQVKPKVSPKPTATVVLRQGARLMKEEESEIKRYQDLASGAFNSGNFFKLEQTMREDILRERLQEVERKHLEGLITYEEALLAKENCLKRNMERGDEMRREKEEWMRQLEEWRKEENLRIQEKVEKCKAISHGAIEAVIENREQKHRAALETMEESRLLRERWIKEKEAELERKVNVIQEIRALQALARYQRNNTPYQEPCDEASLGLMCEMTLAELKERLVIMRLELKEEVDRRREEFRRRRECRKGMVESYQDLIESHHVVMKQKKDDMKEEKTNEEKRLELMRKSSAIEGLQRKLEEKRVERFEKAFHRKHSSFF